MRRVAERRGVEVDVERVATALVGSARAAVVRPGRTAVARERKRAKAVVVVFVPGLVMPLEGGVEAATRAVAEAGASEAVVLELPGRGETDAWVGSVGDAFEAYAAHVALVLDKLGVTTRVRTGEVKLVMVGGSMGGAVAAKFADTNPELVHELVLLAPASVDMHPFVQALIKAVAATVPTLVQDAISAAVVPRIVRTSFEREIPRERQATENAKFVQSATTAQDPLVLGPAMLRSLLTSDFQAVAKVYRGMAFSRPVHLVWGEADGVVPYPLAKPVLEALRNRGPATLVTIPRGNHYVLFDHVDEVIGVLGGVFAKLP